MYGAIAQVLIENEVRKRKEAACIVCSVVAAIRCLAWPLLTIYASAAGM
jgi:hypothetical protein